MNSGYDKVPDSATLHLFAFADKRLLNAEKHYSNIEHEAPEYCMGWKGSIYTVLIMKCASLLTQAINCNTQQGCGHTVTENAAHYAENTPIQGMHYIQSWSSPIHSKLVVPEQT